MSERPSMWSQMVRASMLKDAICPGCGETNRIGQKAMIELTDDGFYCNTCGHPWESKRPRVQAVNE